MVIAYEIASTVRIVKSKTKTWSKYGIFILLLKIIKIIKLTRKIGREFIMSTLLGSMVVIIDINK
jgi:hypothetical protein